MRRGGVLKHIQIFFDISRQERKMYLTSVVIGRRPDLVESCSGAGGLRSPHNRIPPTSPPHGMCSPPPGPPVSGHRGS